MRRRERGRWGVALIGLAFSSVALAGGPPRPRPSRAVILAAVPAPAGDPPVEVLQRAAIRTSQLEPERVDAWLRRARTAALAPSIRVRVGRGTGALTTSVDYDGATRLTMGDRDAWTFEIGASWNLDRLVWNPDEVRIAHEAQRAAARREKLVAQVAALYAERCRLKAALALAPPVEPLDRVEAEIRIDELGAVLDGLTGGALRAWTSRSPDHSHPPPTAPPPLDDQDPADEEP